MKTATIITFLTLSLEVLAADCVIKETSIKGKVYVLPHYEASVNYFFDKKSRDAFATVSWQLNEDKTRACFNETQTQHPHREVVIPSSRGSHLSVRVKGGTKESTITMYQQANGHFFGDSDSIPVSFAMKKEIEATLASGGGLVEIFGDLSFVMTTETKKVLGTVTCTKESEEAGILVLQKRMKEIHEEAIFLRNRGKIDMEEVMSEFLGTCVTFNNVEAVSFEEFERQQRLQSRIKKENFEIVGTTNVSVSEALPAVSSQKIHVMDI